MIDVGMVARHLLKDDRFGAILKASAKRLELTIEEWFRCIVLLVALHDIGKATPTFQRKWPQGAPPEAMSINCMDVPHGHASAILLCSMLCEDKGWSAKAAQVMANAVGIHHGQLLGKGYYNADRYDEKAVSLDRQPWRRWRRELLDCLTTAFGELPRIAVTRVLAVDWAFVAGLTSVADWIGSGLEYRLFDTLDVDGYMAEREADITVRLSEIGWHTDGPWFKVPTDSNDFASWFGFAPRELQRKTVEISGSMPEGPTLLIIEAPTGEGKTEAALFRSVQPISSRGTYVGMPTQATSNAIHQRVQAFVQQHAFRRTDVALAHSGARVRILQSKRPIELEGKSDADAVAWFSAGRRELLAELGVGTVDQSLLAVVPVKHHTVRLWALAGKTVILDEVHAYDTYTHTLIEQLIRWLAAFECQVIVLSATLPAASRNSLVEAFCQGAGFQSVEPAHADYPRITAVDPTGVRTISFEPDPQRARQVAVRAAPFDAEELGGLAVRLAQKGGAVCVIVNTVKRAQAVYSFCRGQYPDVMLVHAAFPADIRHSLEDRLMKLYGPQSDGVRSGLVIATQVVEQSLDVDFDVLLTDLAPIDLLIQRAGRLHRHNRSDRGAHVSPTMFIAGLTSHDSDAPQAAALETVYEEYLLWRTWAMLVDKEVLSIPSEVDFMVQIAYGTQPLPELEQHSEAVELSRHKAAGNRVKRKQTAEAFKTADPFEAADRAWNLTGGDDEERYPGMVRIPTRLGKPSVTVIPIIETGSEWKLFGTDNSVSSARYPGDAWLVSALSKQLRIGSPEHLVQSLLKIETKSWWQRHRELRFKIPLLLDEQHRLKISPKHALDGLLGLHLAQVTENQGG